jgi:ABC-type multidrug transport system fused ATPase/permease subunit
MKRPHFTFPAGAGDLFSGIRTILGYSAEVVKKRRKELAGSAILKILSFPLGIGVIYATKAALDGGILAGKIDPFIYYTFLGFALFGASRALTYFSDRIIEAVKASFSRDVNRDMTKRLFGLDYLKIRKLTSADNSFVLDYDQGSIETLVFSQVPGLLTLVKLPVFFILAAFMSVPLALLIFVSIPFIAVHTLWASKKKRIYRARELYYLRRHYSRFHDTLANIKIVKSLFKEEWALSRILDIFGKKTKRSLEAILFFRKAGFVNDIFLKANTALFWFIGGYLVIKGRLTFGALGAVSMYTALIVSEMYKLSGVVQSVNAERKSISRCAAFIKEVTAAAETGTKDALAGEKRARGDITFRNVSFGYSPEKAVLKEVSFTAPSGGWTLIKGPSGEGKTTLLSLLLRLFPYSDGAVYIGEHSMLDITRSALRGAISAVHQEPYLLDESIMDNILLGESIDPARLKNILSITRADELARGLPLGYNTRVGEAAYSLSGGQKQRIAIARALAREPGILILDEATSFLDEASEKEVLSGIKESYPHLTVIFVTHRSSALEFADNIFELKDGKMTRETVYNKG